MCEVCAGRARDRGEEVEPVCAVCGGEPLPPTIGPDGRGIVRVCGVCTPLPASVLAELEDEA